MGIDPAPFWANLYLYFHECNFITDLMKTERNLARKFHGISRFIDDLCAINDGNQFAVIYHRIYPKELELKVEHQGNHATFLDLDITIQDGIFIYKLFDKRDAFPFFIVRMPCMCSNIPSTTFKYGSVMSEFLRNARNTLQLTDFIPRARELCERMISQDGSKDKILKQINRAMNRHPVAFESFNTTPVEILKQVSSFA